MHMSVFVVRSTDLMSVAKNLVSGSPDLPDEHKNASGLVSILLKKGHFRRQAINLAPSRRVRAKGDSLLRFKDVSLGAPDNNAGFPESISDDLNGLPPKPGNT